MGKGKLKKIITTGVLGIMALLMPFVLTGCNKEKEDVLFNVKFEYGKAAPFFENTVESDTVKSTEWITTIPKIKEEYKGQFLGWFVKGSDTEIMNYSYIGGDCVLEARFDINSAPSGLYENGRYVKTWGDLKDDYSIVISTAGDEIKNVSSSLSGELVLDKSISKIGDYAFNSSDLTKIIIPDEITSIGIKAFYGCEALTEIRLPKSLNEISFGMFKGCVSLQEVEIPAGVNSIWGEAFENCKSLKEIVLPKNVGDIDENAFKGCDNLRSVTICGNIKAKGVFKECASLTNISIEAGVSYLGAILQGCTGITKVVLPTTLDCIDDMAFYNCTSLQEVYIPRNVSYISNHNIFSGCDNLKMVELAEGNAHYEKFSNKIIEKATNSIVCGIPSTDGKLYTGYDEDIAKSGWIANYAFYGCNLLTEIESLWVGEIGYYSFAECKNLKSVNISSSVMAIRHNAFYGCDSLETFTLSTKTGHKWQVSLEGDNGPWVDVSTMDIDTLIDKLKTEGGCCLKQVAI